MSLVGVFVTASAIVFAGDTAIRGPGDFEVGSKITQCGPSAYAGVTGWTDWALYADRDKRQLIERIKAIDIVAGLCLHAESTATVRVLAERIIDALARTARDSFPQTADERLTDETLLTLVVAGYDAGRPAVVSVQINRVTAPSRDFVVRDWLDSSRSCMTLMGSIRPSVALRDGLIPEFAGRAEVLGAAGTVPASDASCPNLSAVQAERFFQWAVDVSFARAAEFGLEQGIVNWPIDLGIIYQGGMSQPIRRLSK
jgi:hypothetical protein